MAPEQRGPYEEQRTSLARLLQKTYLTDLDRKRILACLVNLRMICDSTHLFDKSTNVSPKLDEFAELMRDVMPPSPPCAAEGNAGDGYVGDHKAVVFSQWEQMLVKASEVLDRLGLGYAMLHGGLPGRDRREVLELFRTDPACRVFLSTDAGGVGLNLQAADTVINLELPWNPAVLEQRIARVHRMGQERPVRVIHLVTRGSIEERVQRTLEQKRSLFAGVFEGDGDEVCFAALGRPAFLDGVRDLIGESPARGPEPAGEKGGETVSLRPPRPGAGLWAAGVPMLEALADLAAGAALPPELAARARAAVEQLRQALATGDEL
jgi:SNF2 family DNA or RNA helicase